MNYDIGIIGGGQLGKMLLEESMRWNYKIAFLEKDEYCPASLVSTHQKIGDINDASAIIELAQDCDVITYEIEHINVSALLELEEKGKKIIPSPLVLRMIQDKGNQKKFYSQNNLPTAAYFHIDKQKDLESALQLIKSEKVVFKSRLGGYDGKGINICHRHEIDKIKPFGFRNCIMEEFIPFRTEISVIVAYKNKDEIAVFPPVEMEFDTDANLVKYIYCPSFLDEDIQDKAKKLALQAIQAIASPGIYAVEMLLTNDNTLIINEIAPRPHNSGHHTIECCYTSQYEQLLRILMDLPLGSTEMISPAVMINIIGPTDVNGNYKLMNEKELLQEKGLYLHMYGKKTTKPFRKLGHITILNKDAQQIKNISNAIYQKINIQAVN